jgi:hypothetical protein
VFLNLIVPIDIRIHLLWFVSSQYLQIKYESIPKQVYSYINKNLKIIFVTISSIDYLESKLQ